MSELWEVAKLIRSKNAGPWELTFDIMFESPEMYERCRRSALATAAFYSNAYHLEESQVRVYECPDALAIKATIPRAHSAGAPADTDIFGGQFHSPIVRFVVPEPTPADAAEASGGHPIG